jgi:hypothetical protein
MTKKYSLPEEIYVYREQDGNDSYLSTFEEIEEAAEATDEDNVIGTYKLVHEAKYTVEKIITEL